MCFSLACSGIVAFLQGCRVIWRVIGIRVPKLLSLLTGVLRIRIVLHGIYMETWVLPPPVTGGKYIWLCIALNGTPQWRLLLRGQYPNGNTHLVVVCVGCAWSSGVAEVPGCLGFPKSYLEGSKGRCKHRLQGFGSIGPPTST